LKGYLNQDYYFFLEKNSSKLITNLTKENDNFINGFVIPLLYMLTDVALVFSILLVIVILKLYNITFVILSILFFGYLSIRAINKYIVQWGNERQAHQYEKNKNVNHILHGIKEIIIFNASNFFLKKFQLNILGISKISYKHSTAIYLPKIILEILGIFSIVILILYLTRSDFSSNKIIVITGFYIALAYRLIPCFNRIITSYNSIKFYSSTLNVIYDELILLKKVSLDSTDKKISFDKEIILKNVSFKYPEAKDYIIENANIEIKKGEIIGVLGKSGVGKTTLINIIGGLLKPTSGTLSVDNNPLNSNFLIRSFQNIISYVPQHIYLMDETIKKNIAIGIEEDLIDETRINHAVNNSGLREFVDLLPNKIDAVVGERGSKMSGGERQRLGIARSLYFNTDIIIFDESTNSLDKETEEKIMQIIYSLKEIKTIFIITHKREILKNCHKIFSINNKKIILEDRSV
jgi:ABC-type bacteriocin/lantibiotic exporter with double-glycine peptidase domain